MCNCGLCSPYCCKHTIHNHVSYGDGLLTNQSEYEYGKNTREGSFWRVNRGSHDMQLPPLAPPVYLRFVSPGTIAAVSSLRLGGGGPAMVLCLLEACRCVTVLALTFAVVRAGIKPEAPRRDGGVSRSSSRWRRRTVSRS